MGSFFCVPIELLKKNKNVNTFSCKSFIPSCPYLNHRLIPLPFALPSLPSHLQSLRIAVQLCSVTFTHYSVEKYSLSLIHLSILRCASLRHITPFRPLQTLSIFVIWFIPPPHAYNSSPLILVLQRVWLHDSTFRLSHQVVLHCLTNGSCNMPQMCVIFIWFLWFWISVVVIVVIIIFIHVVVIIFVYYVSAGHIVTGSTY